MENIKFQLDNLQITTYGKNNNNFFDVTSTNCFFTGDIKKEIGVESYDELLLVFYSFNKVKGFIKLSLEDCLKFEFASILEKAIKENNIDPKTTLIYYAPCLTFSHCPINKDTMEQLLNNGYELAVKGTSGVYYVDPFMLTFAELRKVGFSIENVYFSDYDTFENENLLYSKSRGDLKSNITVF